MLPEEVGRSLGLAFRIDPARHYGFAMPKGSNLKPVVDQLLDDLEASGELGRLLVEHQGWVDEVLALPALEPHQLCADGC